MCPGICYTRGTELDTGLQCVPIKGKYKGKDLLSWPAGSILPNAAKNNISLLSNKGTLLTHVQISLSKHTKNILAFIDKIASATVDSCQNI